MAGGSTPMIDVDGSPLKLFQKTFKKELTKGGKKWYTTIRVFGGEPGRRSTRKKHRKKMKKRVDKGWEL